SNSPASTRTTAHNGVAWPRSQRRMDMTTSRSVNQGGSPNPAVRVGGEGLLLAVVGEQYRGHGGDVDVVGDVHDLHAGGVASLGGDAPDLHADGGAGGGDDEDLVVDADHERRDDLALLGGDLDAPDALAAAALGVELVQLGAL